MSQKPTPGRIVHYILTEQDADAINQRRADTVRVSSANGHNGDVSLRRGNRANAGDVYPAMVVRVWGDYGANLQVFLDGNDAYWATSKSEGDQPGTWAWPTRA